MLALVTFTDSIARAALGLVAVWCVAVVLHGLWLARRADHDPAAAEIPEDHHHGHAAHDHAPASGSGHSHGHAGSHGHAHGPGHSHDH